jgi:hypothetical protein
VAGVATSGTVLSITRWAVDIGCQVTVCAALLKENVFPAELMTAWTAKTSSPLHAPRGRRRFSAMRRGFV